MHVYTCWCAARSLQEPAYMQTHTKQRTCKHNMLATAATPQQHLQATARVCCDSVCCVCCVSAAQTAPWLHKAGLRTTPRLSPKTQATTTRHLTPSGDD
jgi:hypothetical protein